MSKFNEETYRLAKSVNDAAFQSLLNAQNATDEKQADHYFRFADKLESKFKNEFGHHPTAYIEFYEKSKGTK